MAVDDRGAIHNPEFGVRCALLLAHTAQAQASGKAPLALTLETNAVSSNSCAMHP
jgi:hypothetical protein